MWEGVGFFCEGLLHWERVLEPLDVFFPIVRIPKRRQVLNQTVGHCFLFLIFSGMLITNDSFYRLKEVLGTWDQKARSCNWMGFFFS